MACTTPILPVDPDRFAAMVRDDASSEDLAEAFGISVSSARRWRRDGIPAARRPRKAPAPRASVDPGRFAAMVREGATNTELAEAFECSPATVSRWRARLGVPGPVRRAYSADDLALIEDRLADGWSVAEIHRTHGFDPETVRRHFPGRSWSPEDVRALSMATRAFWRRRGTLARANYAASRREIQHAARLA